MLWLLASEDKNMEGYLPDIKTISFRLRMPEKDIRKAILELKHWVISDDINMISERYQDDAPERERETYSKETEKEYTSDFENLWLLYPRKDGSKAKAFESYKKALKEGIDHGRIESGVRAYAEYIAREGTENKHIAHCTTWLNQSRWESNYSATGKSYTGKTTWKSEGERLSAKYAADAQREEQAAAFHDDKPNLCLTESIR